MKWQRRFPHHAFQEKETGSLGTARVAIRAEPAPMPLPEILNFRTVVGRFKTLLQTVAPHLRRQSSRYREAQSSVLQSSLRFSTGCCCGRWWRRLFCTTDRKNSPNLKDKGVEFLGAWYCGNPCEKKKKKILLPNQRLKLHFYSQDKNASGVRRPSYLNKQTGQGNWENILLDDSETKLSFLHIATPLVKSSRGKLLTRSTQGPYLVVSPSRLVLAAMFYSLASAAVVSYAAPYTRQQSARWKTGLQRM